MMMKMLFFFENFMWRFCNCAVQTVGGRWVSISLQHWTMPSSWAIQLSSWPIWAGQLAPSASLEVASSRSTTTACWAVFMRLVESATFDTATLLVTSMVTKKTIQPKCFFSSSFKANLAHSPIPIESCLILVSQSFMGVVLQTCNKAIETVAWFCVSNILKERKELQIIFPHAIVHCWWKHYCNKTKVSTRIGSSFFQPCLWRRKGGLEIKSSSFISDEAGCLPVSLWAVLFSRSRHVQSNMVCAVLQLEHCKYWNHHSGWSSP